MISFGPEELFIGRFLTIKSISLVDYLLYFLHIKGFFWLSVIMTVCSYLKVGTIKLIGSPDSG